jgi:hypothetical protein
MDRDNLAGAGIESDFPACAIARKNHSLHLLWSRISMKIS